MRAYVRVCVCVRSFVRTKIDPRAHRNVIVLLLRRPASISVSFPDSMMIQARASPAEPGYTPPPLGVIRYTRVSSYAPVSKPRRNDVGDLYNAASGTRISRDTRDEQRLLLFRRKEPRYHLLYVYRTVYSTIHIIYTIQLLYSTIVVVIVILCRYIESVAIYRAPNLATNNI